MSKTIQSGIIQTDISDHFPIFSITNDEIIKTETKKETIYKREINEKTKDVFKSRLQKCTWVNVTKKNEC